MSFQEQIAWVFGLSLPLGFLVYAAIVAGRMLGTPVAQVAYVVPMLWSIGSTVVATILGSTVAGMQAPKDVGVTHERDVAISRYADATGLWVLSIAVLGPLGLAMLQVEHFWIANALYLACVAANLVSTTAKLVAYRRGSAPW